MKKHLMKLCMPLLIALVATSLYAVPIAHAEIVTVQDTTKAFIQTTLPLDLSKYTITSIKQSLLNLPGDVVQYMTQSTLNSAESTIQVICNIRNNNRMSCQLVTEKGSVISDKQYISQLDAVKSFLEKYQNYTKMDSTNLISMLDKVEVGENVTKIAGNTKLTITNMVSFGNAITNFNWAYTINGLDYTSLQVSFQKNGALYTLYDDRSIYTIGDTSINISKDQAIDIALKNLPTYSYEMPDGSIVSDFNITKDKIDAILDTSPIESTVLKPYWTVALPLNQTYPGSVHGIEAFIWADTGKIITYGNIAFGGADYYDNPNLYATSSSAIVSSPIASAEGNTVPVVNLQLSEPIQSQPAFIYCLLIAVIIIVVTGIVGYLFYKRSR
jgi:hypothetical protein